MACNSERLCKVKGLDAILCPLNGVKNAVKLNIKIIVCIQHVHFTRNHSLLDILNGTRCILLHFGFSDKIERLINHY